MKKQNADGHGRVKQSRFPPSLFAIFFIILLLMSGIHTGLITLGNKEGWSAVVQTLVPLLYWGAVAAGLTLFTRRQIRIAYEEPLHKLGEATQKVANGNFSVFVPTFNTPLAVIQSNAELLNMEHLSEEQRRECTETILHATKRLSNLIMNMLKLNKLEKQTIKPMPQTYDLCAQLCECALQFEDRWEEKGIEFVAELEDRVMTRADEGLMELVWTNLLSNAIKFTPTGGTVTLSQTSDEKEIILTAMKTLAGSWTRMCPFPTWQASQEFL